MSLSVKHAVKTSTITNPVQMAVLKELADVADDEGYCWPSIVYIQAGTKFSAPTIKRAIAELCKSGHLIRTRRFNQTNIYRITPVRSDLASEFFTHTTPRARKAALFQIMFQKKVRESDFGSQGPEEEMGSERSHQEVGMDQSDLINGITAIHTMGSERSLTHQYTHHLDKSFNNNKDGAEISDLKSEKAKPSKKAEKVISLIDRPDDVDTQVWDDFLKVRSSKTSAPLTITAINSIKKEAVKAGITLQAALETAIEGGWRSFKAEWIDNHQQKPKKQASARLGTSLPSSAFKASEDGML
ncbi:MAG TPA: helix-turn-helix domain-containing protein [Limnobacter sp.]|uniref:helix-turn-helix domain-containing protein n=1 Tax=Limnobacter sp. TaxID=2003368 RepID=UPI002ED88AEA